MDFDGDGDVEVDATVDGQIILVNIATSSEAADSIVSPRAIRSSQLVRALGITS